MNLTKIETYVEMLKETHRILQGFRIKHEFEPPAIQIKNEMIPPGDLDLSKVLQIKMKIIGEKNIKVRTIEDAIIYLTTIQSIFSQYQESLEQLPDFEKKNEREITIIPATLFIKVKYPDTIIKLKLNEKGLATLKTILRS